MYDYETIKKNFANISKKDKLTYEVKLNEVED